MSRIGSSTVETFEVKLEEVSRVFYPGESVCGRINLKLKEDLKIKELRLECRGEAYVNWPEYSGSYTRYHYNREKYFNAMAVVFGGGNQQQRNGINSSACISQGRYSFSFKFIIPDKYLPTSFEGRHGNIRYWARAVIDRGLGTKNVKTKPAPFLIGDYVALEDFEHVSDALMEQDSLATGWPCFPSGTLELRAETDRGGFKQGDDIHISVLVTNETTRDVTSTEVSLVQRTLFVDIGGGKTFSDHTICSVRKEGVFSGWEQEYPKMTLAIPPNTYPTLISCKCIAVLYFILVRSKLKGKFRNDAYIEIPIIIASSDDQSIMLAQENKQALPTSQRPKRGKGMFFCVTGKNSFPHEEHVQDSNVDLCEVNGFIISLDHKMGRKNSNISSDNSKSGHMFTPRRESDDSVFFHNNSQFKQISIV